MGRWLRWVLYAGLVISLVSCAPTAPHPVSSPAPSHFPSPTPSPQARGDIPDLLPSLPAGPRQPVVGLRLAFATERDGNSEIYLMTLPGQERPAGHFEGIVHR